MHVWRGGAQLFSGAGGSNPKSDGEATFCAHEGQKSMYYDSQYKFHLRVWISETQHSDFASDGVRITRVAPGTPGGRGQVVESTNKKAIIGDDVDHLKADGEQSSLIVISWADAFSVDASLQADIVEYEVSVGTDPLTANVYGPITIGHPLTTKAVLLRDLWYGAFYYSTVVAINSAGLRSWVVSDGFVIDETRPITGTVRDGMRPGDVEYQSSTTITSRWQGFTDAESRVTGYIWSVGTKDADGTVVEDVLQDQARYIPSGTFDAAGKVQNGMRYFVKVQAKNAAGLLSEPGYSDGVTVDTTAPEIGVCKHPGEAKNTANILSDDPGWNVDGAAYLFTNGTDQRHTGHSTYALPSTSKVECALVGLDPAARYRLRFYGSVRCAFFDRNSQSRTSLSCTPLLRLKRACV
jgi:hypothetical protein